MVLTENHMTIEQTARFLGRSRESIYAAVRRGRLRPVKRGRRNFFDRDEVQSYQRHLRERFPSKEEAMRLYEHYPTLPVKDDGTPLVERRAWDIFVAYGSDLFATYDTVAEEFAVTRQRVAQVVTKTIDRLLELDDL